MADSDASQRDETGLERWDRNFIELLQELRVAQTGVQIPPIPPHAEFEQIKDAAEAIIKGDPDAAGIVRKGMKTKAQELFTRGKN
jgi:pyruvate dehydrogenase (quinone)